MTKELSIKVSIANRVYPLSIDSSEEEAIRKAAKMLNEMVKDYESTYSVKDKQDLLAMCALEFATQRLKLENEDGGKLDGVEEEIKNINHQLTDFLAKH